MSADLGIKVPITVEVTGKGDLETLSVNLEGLKDSGDAVTSSTTNLSISTTNWSKALSAGGGIAGHAVIAVDRLSIAQNAVENAQTRQMIATDRLNHVLEKYGAGSKEATQAQRELEISTRGVEIANDRMFVRMVFGVGILIPEMVSQFKNLKKALDSVTLSTIFQTEATHGLTRAKLLLLGVSTLGIGAAVGFAAGSYFAAQTPSNNVSNNVNVYGDINMEGVNNPQDFTARLQQQTQISRMSR